MGMGKEGKEAADTIPSLFPDAGYSEPGREQGSLPRLESAQGPCPGATFRHRSVLR